MRRSAVLEGVNHCTKLSINVVIVVAQRAKYPIEDLWVMIAHATGADFVAIHYHIVLIGNYRQFFFVGRNIQCLYPALWHAKWVVAEVNFFTGIIPFVEWEVDNPAKCDDIRVFQAEMVGELATQTAKDFVYHATPICTEDYSVAISRAGRFLDGSQIGLNNGGTWFLYDILAAGVAPSLSVAALTDNRLFDIFAYPYNGTQIALEGVSWTSDTLRAVTLTVIDGIPTKSGDNTRRYLGTARKRGGIVYCSGNYKFVELWNMYNRVPVPFEITDPTATWAIAASATWRQADANASNQVNFCIGYRWGNFTAHARSRALNSTATARKIFTGIGIDSITVATNRICTPGHCTNAIAGVAMADAHGDFNFNAGQHYLAWLERGDGVETQTFQGSNGDEFNGMIGEIWA